jgi:hypothetical protein
MKRMEQSNKNSLNKNFDEYAIQSIINNAKSNEKPVLAWKFVAGKKMTVEVVFYIIRKARKELIVRAASRDGKKLLGELAASANNLNFYLPEDMALFQSEVKQIEVSGDIRITMPSMIAQVDRRKDFRLFIENGIRATLEFQKRGHGQRQLNQFFKKECFDISASGASFVVSKSEKKFFQRNDLIKSLSVKLGGVSVEIGATVVGITEIEPLPSNNLHYRGWKIAIEFSEISSENSRLIGDYVFRYLDLDKAI